MLLDELLKDIDIEYIKGDKNINIKDIKYDSREIKKNDLFIKTNTKIQWYFCISMAQLLYDQLILS